MADFPLILAGPIVRRVEPRLATIWVALSQPRAVLLSIFRGRVQTGGGPGIFTGTDGLEMSGAANTLRLGDHLHVAVVYAEFLADEPMFPGLNYSYDVGFGPFVASVRQGGSMLPGLVNVEADLKSEGLLSDQPLSGRPNLPLGYDVGELPGFALPPPALTDLRLLHGSCRRPGKVYESGQGKKTFDGMAWVDDLIAEWRRGAPGSTALDPNIRPHQLFLTGDQIYADDVATAMLPMLNRVGNALIGKTERLPTRYPPEADAHSREVFLGTPKQPGFEDLESFIAAKRSEGKDPLEELKNDKRVRVLSDPCFDRLFGLLFADPFRLEGGFDSDPAAPGVRFWPTDLDHFPAGLRRPILECEAKFSSTDLASHLMSLGEYCAMYLAVWSNTAWEMDGAEPRLAKIDEIYALPAASPLPQLWDLHACFVDGPTRPRRTERNALDRELGKLRASASRIQGIQNHHDTLGVFFQSLPRVRRALANIPTYMVFDDHDVTDDWNITRAWRDRVHTSPLGRSVLISSLVSYALFQDWGNDPKRYEGGPYRALLDQALAFFPEGSPSGPPVAVTEELGRMFALNQPDPEPAPALKWHYTVDGPAHRVVVLDTRTRRVFRSRHQPSGLLSPQALDDQLPDPALERLPAGVEVLVVVSQTPALQPSLASSLIIPLMTSITELKHHENFANQTGLDPDNEIWPGDDLAFHRFLERLARYRRVVVLSGEVHFGYGAQLSFWKKGIKRLTLAAGLRSDLDDERLTAAVRGAFDGAGLPLSEDAALSLRADSGEWSIVDPPGRRTFLVRDEGDRLEVFEEDGPARVAQFVSSGLKNAKDLIVTLGRGMGFAFALLDLTPVERLIWNEHFPAPLTLPEGVHLPLPVRGRLGRDPVMLPSRDWPPGVRVKKQPDFAWRIDLVRDERPDGERLDFTRPSGPPPEFDVHDVHASYRAIAARHAAQLAKVRFTRGVVYQVNLGLVRFERAEGVLVACQDLYSHPPGKHEAALVNVYRVALERFDDLRPRLAYDVPGD